MIPRSALRHRHGLLSSTSCLSKTSPTSPPNQRIAPRQQRRAAHTIPPIGRHNDRILKHGVDGLFSPAAIEQNWSIYMKYLLNRVNDLVTGTPKEGFNLKQLLIDTARNPASANTFNYASQAHNHHFFMQTLSPTEGVSMPADLSRHLTRTFSSLDTLRSTFLTTAASMFGPGYVWLVLQFNPSKYSLNNQQQQSFDIPGMQRYSKQNPHGSFEFRILPTYLAGSPYPGAHARLQSRDLTTENEESLKARRQQTTPQNGVGAFGPANQRYAVKDRSDADIKMWGGADIMPVMCVSTWEHAYMMDWGIDGKRFYLESWWDHIDWEQVWANAGLAAKDAAIKGKLARP